MKQVSKAKTKTQLLENLELIQVCWGMTKDKFGSAICMKGRGVFGNYLNGVTEFLGKKKAPANNHRGFFYQLSETIFNGSTSRSSFGNAIIEKSSLSQIMRKVLKFISAALSICDIRILVTPTLSANSLCVSWR